MYHRRWITACFAALCAGASLSFTAPPPAPSESPTTIGEVRLRKLHLVRPDLIPYPVAYEVYC